MLQRLKTFVGESLNRSTVRLRRLFYARESFGRRTLSRSLPRRLAQRLGLDDRTAFGSRKLEIGPGGYPTPGYIHMDIRGAAPHLEAVGPMWKLPFADGWAEEIRGIHTL